ncbi:MAG TPA: M12 family metallopeptidase [Allosphingosinicella sp.]|nr:M12 family metallopeptidase [Allosphingosinicella sp.]
MAQAPTDGAADREHGVETFHTIPDKPRIGTALISGSTFVAKPVQYVDIDGMAIVEGDIALGTTADVDAATEATRQMVQGGVAFGVGISGPQFRWPNCRVPIEIDPNLPNQARVTNAIAHWESNTGFRFPTRTNEQNWVFFTDAGGCWSLVGMRGNRQTISLGPNCTTGNAIHEIGHAIGLWHEQSREDRDQFVTINWQNIQSGMASQFQQHITDGDDLGAYDYGSIMHYPRTAFSKNNQDTITPVDPNAQIGQRNGLSPGDIAAVRAMYPNCHVKNPLTEPVKQPLRDPVKALRDPPRFKKLLDDERFLKNITDPVKAVRDPGPVKGGGRDVRTIPTEIGLPGPLAGGGGLRPFALATPHHAPGLDSGGSEAEMIDAALQRQLLELDAAIGRAQATVAETTLELNQLVEAREALTKAYLGGS